MSLKLISPAGLEADAVVPQCLDNQYVSDAVFLHMVNNGIDYSDTAVTDMRASEIQTAQRLKNV